MRGQLTCALLAALIGATPASAEVRPILDPVDAFVRAAAATKWDDAKPLLKGVITQLTGVGPTVVGGPYAGQWQQQIFAGKAAVGFDDLVASLKSCTFGEARLLSGTAVSSDKVVKVTFVCVPAHTVHFVVRRVVGQPAVSVSDLGKDLIAAQATAAAGAQ